MSTISDLMEMDPLKLTRENIDEIILHFRESRERYVSGVKAPKDPKEPKTKVSINLADLGL